MAKTYRTPTVVALGNADVLTTALKGKGKTIEPLGSTSLAMLDL